MFGRDRRAINVPPAAEKAAEKQLLQLWDRLDSTSRLRAIEYLTQLTELQEMRRPARRRQGVRAHARAGGRGDGGPPKGSARWGRVPERMGGAPPLHQPEQLDELVDAVFDGPPMRYHQPPPAPVDPYAAGPLHDRVPGVVLPGQRYAAEQQPAGPAANPLAAAFGAGQQPHYGVPPPAAFAPQPPALQFHGAQRVDPFDHGMTVTAPREEQRGLSEAEPSPIRGEVGAAAAGARAALGVCSPPHGFGAAEGGVQSGESPGFMSSLMNMHVGESPTEVARREQKRKQWLKALDEQVASRGDWRSRLHAERAAEDDTDRHLKGMDEWWGREGGGAPLQAREGERWKGVFEASTGQQQAEAQASLSMLSSEERSARARAVAAERAAFTRQNAVRASCQKGLGAVGGVGAAPRVQRPSSPGAFTGKPVAAEAAKKAGAK